MQKIDTLYQHFNIPITALDCGKKCSPYNEQGVPFCCDTRHVVPAIYDSEWTYFQGRTELWRLWVPEDEDIFRQVQEETPQDMILVECQGHKVCQREYRSIACRSFPFFPYLSSQNEFVGMAYYWEYEDRCWVISNLDKVSDDFRQQFVEAYAMIFGQFPDEKTLYAEFSKQMREIFADGGRVISLLHREGEYCIVSPISEQIVPVQVETYEKFGPYEVAFSLPFPDEE